VLRFVKPSTTVLALSGGDTITIRTRLTHGEEAEAFARQTTVDENGRVRLDPRKYGDALLLAYLVDWTPADPETAAMPIRGLSMDELADVIRNLDGSSFREIRAAIEAHEEKLSLERMHEKKTDGVTASVAT
jgi:hypothetical protein